MKLLTREIEKKLERNPIYSHDGAGLDAPAIVKYFSPVGTGTWIITEGEKQENGDWLLYGYMEVFGDYEWGYIMLSELENTGTKLKIERDLYAHGTVRELM